MMLLLEHSSLHFHKRRSSLVDMTIIPVDIMPEPVNVDTMPVPVQLAVAVA